MYKSYWNYCTFQFNILSQQAKKSVQFLINIYPKVHILIYYNNKSSYLSDLKISIVTRTHIMQFYLCIYIIILKTHTYTYKQQFQMNFDDDLDIGYTPTIASNSRSAGMKKITRKSQQKPPAVSTKRTDDFDLLDQLLASPKKQSNNKSNVQKNKNISINLDKNANVSNVDDFFDQPTFPKSNKNQKIPDQPVSRPMTAKPVINVMPVEDQILEQVDNKNSSSFKFKRPETAVNISNVNKKVQEQPQITISPSLRMMKPPLRKRQSKEQKPKQQLKLGGSGLGLMLPEQTSKTSFASKEDDSKFKMLPKRRSSIQMTASDFNGNLGDIQQKKVENQFNRPSLNLNANSANTQPKINLFNTFQQKQKQKQQNYSLKLQIKPDPPKQQPKKPLWQPQKSILIEQNNYNNNMTKKFDNNQPSKPKFNQQQQISSKQRHEDIQKQIQFIKRNYQKHIDSLQQNLEDQIKINKQSRDRLMRQANNMIQNQRERIKKIQAQELERVKQMGEWEKKKIQDTYKRQIQSLKMQIQKFNNAMQTPQNTTTTFSDLNQNRRQIQYLQQKLRTQRRLLQQKSKLLDKKQLDLQQREKQFNKRKRFQEERLRNEQKRIFEYQLQSKKNILNQKRNLEGQKQQMATQLATLEIDNYKKVQNIQYMKSQYERQRQLIDKEKSQLRNLSNTMLLQYQKKNQQLRKQKEKVAKLQSQLIQKIRIVQAHGSKNRTNVAVAKPKQNNWTKNHTINKQINVEESVKRSLGLSIQKQNQQKKYQNTQTRFMNLTSNLKQNFKCDKKGKQFDLDNYLMSMANYTRGRQQIH